MITKRLISVFLVLALALCGAVAEQAETPTLTLHFDPEAADMLKYGHMALAIHADEFLQTFELSDIVTVTVDGFEPIDMPICADYDDVGAGEMLLRAKSGKDIVLLAMNYGCMGKILGMVTEAPEGSETTYVRKECANFDMNVTVTLKEKYGWADRLKLSALVRVDEITGYAGEMTEAQFANFRMIETTGMGKGVLYRSSSPIGDSIGRKAYADRCAEAVGIRTFINLADTEAEALAYGGYADTYYSKQNVTFLGLPAALATNTFRVGLASGFRAIIAGEAPYLVHCAEGKDRAGFVSAVLELLMGASLSEVCDDYLMTYENYNAPLADGGEQLTDELRDTIREVLIDNLSYGFGIESIETIQPRQAVEDYLCLIGMTEDEIVALKAALSVNIDTL